MVLKCTPSGRPRKPLRARLRTLPRAWPWVLLSLGCSASVDPASGDLRRDLRHKDPRVRIQSAYRAVEARRRDLLDDLIDNLADRDEAVRFITGIALKKLTGQDFGYTSYGSLSQREEAIARWRRWLQGEGPGSAAPPVSTLPAAGPIPPGGSERPSGGGRFPTGDRPAGPQDGRPTGGPAADAGPAGGRAADGGSASGRPDSGEGPRGEEKGT